MLIFACSKVTTHEDTTPQSKFALIKQSTAAYFGDYANAFRATGHKYFGKAHDGTFDQAQFQKDFSAAFNEKHPSVNSPAANKLLIRSWNPKQETLVDYMHQMGVSESVVPYVLEAQNHIVSSFDIAKLESKEQDMGQVVANIVSSMDKLEAKAEQDKSLTESEVISVLVATTAAKSLTSAIVDVTTDFFTNLNVNTARNQASSRSWWSPFRAIFNVVVTVVVRIVLAPPLFLYDLITTLGLLIETGNVDQFFNGLSGVLEGYVRDQLSFLSGNYNCYLPNDGWQCP